MEVGIFYLTCIEVVGASRVKVTAAEDDIVFITPGLKTKLAVKLGNLLLKLVAVALVRVGAEDLVCKSKLVLIFFKKLIYKLVLCVVLVRAVRERGCAERLCFVSCKVDFKFCVADAAVIANYLCLYQVPHLFSFCVFCRNGIKYTVYE